jgi:hypothetical protein
LECVICLNKYLDNRLNLNETKLFDKHNQIYQIMSCKCKFCVNVSIFCFFCLKF